MSTKKEQKFNDIIIETYRLLYKASTPSADFDELVKNSLYEDYNGKLIKSIPAGSLSEEEMHDRQLRHYIPFENYFITEEEMKKIINEQITKYKLKGFDKSSFTTSVYLGCSPTFRSNEKED